MKVFRGQVSMGGSTTITLPEPVPVGKSFSFVNGRINANDGLNDIQAKGVLQTIVNDHYTELLINRDGSGNTLIVEWQVVTGNDFTVQSGVTNFGTGDSSRIENITEVDL